MSGDTSVREYLDRVYADMITNPPRQPNVVMIDGKTHAMMKAGYAFRSRDRRRIKREMNKAWRRERKKELSHPRAPTLSLHEIWWRNSTVTLTSETT